MNIPGWLHEIQYNNDIALNDYLSFGVQNGFYIVDPDSKIAPYHRNNYSSVLKGDPHHFIDNLIKSELENKKNVLTDTKPTCVHSIEAVPKKSGGWRPITTVRGPLGVLHIRNFVILRLIMP